MSADWIVYLSGRVPLGIWLVPGAGLLFTLVWITVWRGTGFYSRRQFWRILTIGWLIITGGYAAAWLVRPPPARPVRIMVRTGGEAGSTARTSKDACPTGVTSGEACPTGLTGRDARPTASDGTWRKWIVKEELIHRMERSPRPFVILGFEDNPYLAKVDIPTLKNLAPLLHPHWLIQIADSSTGTTDSSVVLSIYEWRKGTFLPVANLPIHSIQFKVSLGRALDSTAVWLGDKSSISSQLSFPPSVAEEDLHDLWLGRRLLESGLKDEAESAFNELITTHPTWLKPRLEVARTMMENRSGERIEEIRQILVGALKLQPDNAECCLRLGQLHLKYRFWSEAESALKLAYNYDPDNPQTLLLMSRLGEPRLEDFIWSGKRQLLERAVYLDEAYEPARLALVYHHRSAGQAVKARKLLETGLRLNPYSELLLLTASVFQLEDFNSEGAVESCRRLLEINPNNAKAWYNQGMGLLNLGRFEEAVLSFQASLNNGGTPNNYFYLGYVYQKQQQWAEALKFYQKRLNFPESSSDPFIDAARNRINDVQAFQRQEVDSLK